MQVDDAIAAAADSFLNQNLHFVLAISQRPQNHRQTDAGDAFDASRVKQLEREVGGGGAENIAQDQYAIAFIDLVNQDSGQRQYIQRIVLRGDAEMRQQRRTLDEHVANVLHQALAQGAVCNEKYADHDSSEEN